MGKISLGEGSNLPSGPQPGSYSEYIERYFAFAVHRCVPTAPCRKLGCGRSYTWIADRVPPLAAVDILLLEWSAYRNKPSGPARERQIPEFSSATKQESVKKAYQLVADLLVSLKDTTILCAWDAAKVAETYDKVAQFFGSTVLITKTLHFLLPDLFVILDRKQSYPPLRLEINGVRNQQVLPTLSLIDVTRGSQYAELLAYVRDEIGTLVGRQIVVTLKDGLTRVVKNVDDFRMLSPRLDNHGNSFPGTICKVVDNFFPKS